MPQDMSEAYEASIQPLVREVMRLCNESSIPVFMAFGIKPAGNGKYELSVSGNVGDADGDRSMEAYCILPETHGIRTRDTRFADFVNIVNGFAAVPSRGLQEFSSDDLAPPAGMTGGEEDSDE